AFVANVSEPNKVWKNDGNGNFTDSGQSLGSFNSMGVSLADVYGDGDVDAFVANVSEPNKVWKNDGSGNFTDSGQSFEDGEDSIKLEGVSFTDLAIEPWGSSTLIKYGEETLATVYRVNADLIGADDFV
ncbi:FG-GAP repeat domain-containing protein, partial [Hydrocoleum sp. CS-953]|uniref:FG-GAP repeat domain-containing protein n=1 Tax=Hydrocoleum sp. CS-953 TaxID=1671698 RepID=UPI00352ADE91